jgi:hypothetical protein
MEEGLCGLVKLEAFKEYHNAVNSLSLGLWPNQANSLMTSLSQK